MNTLKKTFSVLSLGLIITLAVACEKSSDENPEISNGNAVITGKAQANLDLRNDTLANGNPGPAVMENVPVGVKIFARFNSIDLVLNPVPGSTYATQTLTTTVDANGNYSFNVPANSKNVNVTILAEDFYHIVTLTDTTSLTNQKFQSAGSNVVVFNGITEYSDLVFAF